MGGNIMWGIFVAINVVLAAMLVYKLVNHFQLDGYRLCKNLNMLSWSFYLVIIGLIGVLISQLTTCYIDDKCGYIGAGISIVLPIGLAAITMIEDKKTPLKFTKRAVRLYLLIILLMGIVTISLIGIATAVKLQNNLMLIMLTYVMLPAVFYLASAILHPLEKIKQNKFIKECKARLVDKNIIKIGITGSYAKTSVKGIITTMLSRKYNVLATPYSYNTPMGICISTKEITDKTEVFIAEMGARRKGDIKELCDIVKPNIGVLTGIAPTHMGTFKSITNIINTKYELIESLPNNGTAIFNGDNNELSRLFYRCNLRDKYLVKYNAGFVHLENVQVSSAGSSFDLVIGEERRACATVLLGSHNLSNIILGAMTAHCLDVEIGDIAAAISELDYQPHRLQLIKANNGITIIDDSYNCNIEGAKCAVNTLALFPNRKVVLTQGAVEMGDMENEINYKIGLLLSHVADLIIVVGKRGKIIANGLLDGGCNPTKIVEVKTLKQAIESFNSLLRSGDVLLLMNDLPDNYC